MTYKKGIKKMDTLFSDPSFNQCQDLLIHPKTNPTQQRNHATTHLFMHLDMNSYFASVEQQANPFLRGKALGVCAYLHEYGCVIAASVEAKARGMKVGMRVKDARAIIPDAVFVENDPAKYRSVTTRIFRILDDVSDRVEHYSIDEAFIDMTGWVRDEAEAAWHAVRTRNRITREVGEWLRCSIGIAPTRFLAKLASDCEKPSGLTIINQGNLDEILSIMVLQDVYGIGRRMARRLLALGYKSPIEIKRAHVANLMQSFGIGGYFLWAHLNGIPCDHMADRDDAPKSIGHSYCVPLAANRCGRVRGILVKLAEKAARRLRREGLLAQNVSLAITFRESFKLSSAPTPFGPAHDDFRSVRLDEPSSDSQTLIQSVLRSLDDVWDGKRIVSFLAVTYSDFTPPSDQLHLWFDKKRIISSSISHAADTINDRYGDRALIFGSMFGIENSDAPDRIGFRKVDGLGT